MLLKQWLTIHLKKVFMGKEKKQLMFWQLFFTSHKSVIKTFLKLIVHHCPKGVY